MRAALITGQRSIELREFPEPQPVEGAAVVRVDRCGICGTDVSAYRHGNPYGRGQFSRLARTGRILPWAPKVLSQEGPHRVGCEKAIALSWLSLLPAGNALSAARDTHTDAPPSWPSLTASTL